MKNNFKDFVRTSLNFLRLDLTKNLRYDRLTAKIIRNHLSSDASCIDVGAHKGEILRIMLNSAPKGKHFAFEPLPHLYEELKQKYAGERVEILPYALSHENGDSSFHYVRNAPAYSGILKRDYDGTPAQIDTIEVELRTLDHIIPSTQQIDLIKIDVEGGEMGVLLGGKQLLLRTKPLIIFESGLGASEYYGTTPEKLFDFLHEDIGLNLFTLQSYTSSRSVLTKSEFCRCYYERTEYYFVAHH